MSRPSKPETPRYLAATLLLDRPWSLDVDRLAKRLKNRFPGLGSVDALPGQTAGDTGLLMIDRARVVLQSIDNAIEPDAAVPPLKILRTWDPGAALEVHKAQISVSCGGRLPGIEGAQAYSAATHFVTAALADLVRPQAVLWGAARHLIEPSVFSCSADALLQGQLPYTVWVSFAPVIPEGTDGSVTGMVSYGLRPFIGHELELAPRPGGAQDAYRCLAAVVRRVMNDRVSLSEGMRMIDRQANIELRVRERRYWLRRNETAFVLASEDSVIDPDTLRPRDREVA